MGKLVAYRRVSTQTHNQTTDRQLFNIGISFDREYEDYATGTKVSARPELQKCLASLEKEDTLYIHSIDRLARNTQDLLTIVQDLTDRGVGIKFVKEGLHIGDASDPMAAALSSMLLSVIGAVHTFQATMIQESVKEGLRVAKSKGIKLGGANPKHKETFNKNRAAGLHKTPERYAKERDAQAPLVNRLQQMMNDSNNSLTQAEMAHRLNKEGFLGSRGKPLSQNGVSHLIKKYELKKS